MRSCIPATAAACAASAASSAFCFSLDSSCSGSNCATASSLRAIVIARVIASLSCLITSCDWLMAAGSGPATGAVGPSLVSVAPADTLVGAVGLDFPALLGVACEGFGAAPVAQSVGGLGIGQK